MSDQPEVLARPARGRPPGSPNKNAEQLLEQHIRESSRFMGDLREIAESQITLIKAEIKTLPIDKRLLIVDSLINIMEKMGKSMQISVGCLSLLTKEKTNEELSSEDIANILQAKD